MRTLTYFLFMTVLAFGLSSCNKPKGYKTKSGLILYVYSDHHPDSLTKSGHILKLRYTKKVNDSIVESNRYTMPDYQTVMPPFAYPHEPGEVFSMFRKGDSIVLIQSADTLLKKTFYYNVPEYAKKGETITTYFRVLDVFENDSLARLDRDKEFEKVVNLNRQSGPKRLSEYLSEKNIDAKMSKDSIFIETIQEGTGETIDTNSQVTIRFLAATLGGNEIGNNLDTTTTATDYIVGSGRMVPGVDLGLCHLKKGSHARFYIPAMKAFGPSPPPGSENGFQDILFEIKVLNVQDPEN